MSETPRTVEAWRCPECGHVMTEEQSKGYRGCPTGMHVLQHERVTILLSREFALMEAEADWLRGERKSYKRLALLCGDQRDQLKAEVDRLRSLLVASENENRAHWCREVGIEDSE